MGQVANEIYRQINGGRLQVMVNAKNFCACDNDTALSFRFMRSNGVNYLKITLENDLYVMEFGLIHGTKYTVKSRHDFLFSSDLLDIFRSVTGLATNL
jgi:hypothetical protein